MTRSKAYNAGAFVHNVFAAIGGGLGTGGKAVGTAVADFAKGVKNGGEPEAKIVKATPRTAKA
jgi:hypothetical protein